MGSEERLFLRLDEAKLAETLDAVSVERLTFERRGNWLQLSAASEPLAEDLSRQLGLGAVWWSIDTVVDQVWLRCFASRPAEPQPILDPGANSKFQLAPALVQEVQASAARRGVDPSTVLAAAWELGKSDLLTREAAKTRALAEVTLRPPMLPDNFELVSKSLGALKLKGLALSCELRLSKEAANEISTMKLAFGRSGAWYVTEAYLLTRDRVA